MSAGVGVLDPGDEHLGVGEGLFQSGDEGDGTALADVDGLGVPGGGQRPVGRFGGRSDLGAVEGGTGLTAADGQTAAEALLLARLGGAIDS